MRQELLKNLVPYIAKHDWEEVMAAFKPTIHTNINGEAVYEFFQTLDESMSADPRPIAISVNPVNSYVPWHVHDYIDIIVVLQGQARVKFEHEEVSLLEGDLLIVGAYTPHQNFPIEDDTTVINITLKNNAFSLTDLDFVRQHTSTSNLTNLLFFMPAQETQNSSLYTIFRTKQDQKISETVDDIVSEYFNNDQQSNQIIHSSLLIFFARLIRLSQSKQGQVTSSTKSENLLLSFLLYIEKNYASITLEDMGEHFGFNPSYLSTYLKKQTGKSFIKLIHLQRVNVAANYLRYTKISVEQIASKVGYENPSYFYKIFKKTVGISPSEFREQK